MSEQETRNRSLDGLRGFAILVVLFHHHDYLNSGWLAIDLFFVLSGYLITTILRRTRSEIFFWRNFWIKRFTRILPPVLFLLVSVRFVYRIPVLDIFAYLVSLGDVMAYSKFSDGIGPMWSLAIEEHFYILWPFAVRLLSTRTLFYLLGGIIVAEPLLRALGSAYFPDWRIYYYLTPYRLDGLSLGCLLALLMESEYSAKIVARSSGWCIPALCFAWFALRFSLGIRFTRASPSVAYNSLAYTIVSGASFALIAFLITHPNSRISRIFSWRWLTLIGMISYGAYLYQVLIREMVSSTYHLNYRRAFWIDLPVTFLIAWLSYRLYERPITTWGRRKAHALGSRGLIAT